MAARGALLVWALLAALSGCRETTKDPAPPARSESIYGVQLHLHGSHSEGPGSMRGHAAAARALDGAVDVLWWSDHDWRLAAHTYVTSFGFEQGLHEQERVPASLTREQYDGRQPLPAWYAAPDGAGEPPPGRLEVVEKAWRLHQGTPGARFEVSDAEAREGKRSLHVRVESEAGSTEGATFVLETTRRRHIASLASEVRLGLSVLPVAVEGDARLVLSLQLSKQPPDTRGRIDYALTPASLGAHVTRAHVGRVEARDGGRALQVAHIEVPAEPGLWNDWVLEPSVDAARHGLGAEDNSMAEIVLSAEVRGSGRLEAYVDALQIERALTGAALFDRERQMAADLAREGLVQHVGQEISYSAHVNVYGADVPLVDARRHPHGLTPADAVAHAHAYGGIASLNHVFGVGTDVRPLTLPAVREELDRRVDRLIASRAYGADLLEVGYRARGLALDGFLELWDRLALAGLRLTGVGTSDSHDEDVGWQAGPNNFVTWVYARSPSEDDLIEGLRRGRAFFGDPTRFRGALDLAGPAGSRMGDLVFVPSGPQRVRVDAVGLRPGQVLRLMRDGEVLRPLRVRGEELGHVETLDVDGPTFVRVELWDEGERIALSNPLYLARESDPRPLPGSRSTPLDAAR